MLVVRKEGKAHDQYNSFRSAFELLEAVGREPQDGFEDLQEGIPTVQKLQQQMSDMQQQMISKQQMISMQQQHEQQMVNMQQQMVSKQQMISMQQQMTRMQQQIDELKADNEILRSWSNQNRLTSLKVRRPNFIESA